VNNKRNIQDSPADELRLRIEAAARECFRKFGYAKTSMQEIANASGMSAANLYRFYDGKLAIGTAVASAEQTALLAACDRAVAAAGPAVADRLIALFHATIDLSRRNLKREPRLFELSLNVARENQQLRQDFLNAIEARIGAILSAGHPGGAFESAGIKVRSRMILMASAPYVLPWMMLNEPFGDPRSMVEPVIRSLVTGISTQFSLVDAATDPSL